MLKTIRTALVAMLLTGTLAYCGVLGWGGGGGNNGYRVGCGTGVRF